MIAEKVPTHFARFWFRDGTAKISLSRKKLLETLSQSAALKHRSSDQTYASSATQDGPPSASAECEVFHVQIFGKKRIDVRGAAAGIAGGGLFSF
jgi:hypothetical protein